MHHLFSTELNTLNFTFTFAFTSSTYTRVVDFGHYFSPKSTLWLIRESTCTWVYTVIVIEIIVIKHLWDALSKWGAYRKIQFWVNSRKLPELNLFNRITTSLKEVIFMNILCFNILKSYYCCISWINININKKIELKIYCFLIMPSSECFTCTESSTCLIMWSEKLKIGIVILRGHQKLTFDMGFKKIKKFVKKC